MHPIPKLLLTFLAAQSLWVGAAHAGNSESNYSAAASAVVVLLPVFLSVEGSTAVGNSFGNVSNALNQETRWTVTGLEAQGDKTHMTLKSQDNKATLTLAVPSKQIEKANVRLNQVVDAKRLGQHSFAIESNNTPLGVVTDNQAGLVRSKKLN